MITRSRLIALLIVLLPAVSQGQAWQIDESRSSLKFQAIQQDAAFTGEFPEFSAEISLNPDAPDLDLKIAASISMGAVDTAYEERDDYLRSEEFFHADKFPVALFESGAVQQTAGGVSVNGKLTIKADTHPIDMDFVFDAPSGRLRGEGEISRLRFSVGTGMWKDTTWIADKVKILVDVYLEAPP